MTARKAMSQKDMNGLKVVNVGDPTAAQDASTKNYTDTGDTAAKSRANHTGSQLASTISDFDAQVRSSRLDQLAAPTADVGLNGHKVTSLADPASAQDAATKNYVDTQVAGLVTGQILKGAVRVAVGANVNIANPGSATLDGGVALNVGDLVLLYGQTTPSQNGPYVFNGAAAAMTRAVNWDTNAEAVLGSYWVVEMGTKADTLALLSNDTAINLGVTTPTFAWISVAGAAIGRFTTTCPVVAAGASWTVSHNLGDRGVVWAVYRTASPYDDVDIYGVRTDGNTLTLTPDIAMAAGEYTVVVKY
jgi:hypothetical protein